jgi:uncharacterized protein DUF1566
MRNKSIVIVVVLITLSFSVGRLSAGSPDAPGGPNAPAAQMHTLDQIYQRISNGGTDTGKTTTFTEPSTAPGTGTMHTLDEIYDAIGTSAHVPRTTRNLCPCGSPGDDSELRKGVLWPNPRFTDNSNGTVKDNLTGLIWLRNANCFGGQTWAQALADANNLANGACSLTDGSTAGNWRLPNVRELLSLIDYNYHDPAFADNSTSPFLNVQNGRYWSSNTVMNPGQTGNAWDIDFAIGTVNRNQAKTSTFSVWPVRGGQSNP